MAASRSRLLRVLVTAGPTREHLDDVRFLSNGSTGRMGIELAREARRRGARVVLLLGPTDLKPPPGVRTQRVVSTADLLRAARAAAPAADVIVFAAAPADWAPARRLRGKPSKHARGGRLSLVETPDVAATLSRTKGGCAASCAIMARASTWLTLGNYSALSSECIRMLTFLALASA